MTPPVAVEGHQYEASLIRIAVSQVVESGVSLRGMAHQFELWGAEWVGRTPSYSSIRQWMLRIGLYTLHHSPLRLGLIL